MKDETRQWLSYAEENFEIARLALERGYLNACLQNRFPTATTMTTTRLAST
jgi:hypothetical protein